MCKATVGLVHKSPLWRVRDALPYGDGLGVTGIHCSHVLVVPPVSKREQREKNSVFSTAACARTQRGEAPDPTVIVC